MTEKKVDPKEYPVEAFPSKGASKLEIEEAIEHLQAVLCLHDKEATVMSVATVLEEDTIISAWTHMGIIDVFVQADADGRWSLKFFKHGSTDHQNWGRYPTLLKALGVAGKLYLEKVPFGEAPNWCREANPVYVQPSRRYRDFNDFRLSRTKVRSISDVVGASYGELENDVGDFDPSGLVYTGNLYILHTGLNKEHEPRFETMIERSDFKSNNLANIEWQLYRFFLDEVAEYKDGTMVAGKVSNDSPDGDTLGQFIRDYCFFFFFFLKGYVVDGDVFGMAFSGKEVFDIDEVMEIIDHQAEIYDLSVEEICLQ